jgi:hypothetical protein
MERGRCLLQNSYTSIQLVHGIFDDWAAGGKRIPEGDPRKDAAMKKTILFLAGVLFFSALILGCKLSLMSSPTPTPTRTPTITRTPTPTRTSTLTRTPSLTPTLTRTRRPTPTRTYTRTKTPTRTKTKRPTITLTPTITFTPTESPSPTISLTPTATLRPVTINVVGCENITLEVGRRVRASGYLSVPSGSYSMSAPYYNIWLEDYQWSKNRLNIKIENENRPSSMYFSYGVPKIKDSKGDILVWIKQGGNEVYITQKYVTVEGSWEGDCTVRIDLIK